MKTSSSCFENTFDITKLSKEYQDAKPFSHVVIKNILKSKNAIEASKSFLDLDYSLWKPYHNPLEERYICSDKNLIPSPVLKILLELNSKPFISILEKITGINDLIPDPSFHTAGMHLAKRGGKIDVHLDYNIHPKLNLLRKVNLIIFLSSDWKEEWGGQLELWDSNMQNCVKKITPIFNNAAIFTTNDISYHGQPEPTTCPEGETRKTLTLWYHTKIETPLKKRYRGLFFKRPQDPNDPFVDKVREMRSDPIKSKKVYVIDKKKDII